MNSENLLRAPRDIHLLVRKPGSDDDRSWVLRLSGLHSVHIREAVKALRQNRQSHGETISQDSLKPKALQNAVASALGLKSYDDWLTNGQASLIQFLNSNGLTQPKDLLSWQEGTPGFARSLTAQRVADRLFNSGLPLPRRIFTGTGSLLFAAKGYGHYDLAQLLAKERHDYGYDERLALEYCTSRSQQIVLRADRLDDWTPQTPGYLDLTGHQMLLNAFSGETGAFFNLLGSNLIDPPTGEAVFRVYNSTAEEATFYQRLYAVFRDELERSSQGWLDVIPLPGNENIIILKGSDGAFDWVVRDQRDDAFSDNPYYPFMHKAELPSAMKTTEEVAAHLYYRRGAWREKLEHDAETRHYIDGGSRSNWPGYAKLIQRELEASQGFAPSRQRQGRKSPDFLPHRLQDHCLMVSSLVTIRDFWKFYQSSRWQSIRGTRLTRARSDKDSDLSSINLHDPEELPVSVTWLDAIAYCKAYEELTGLPVRLLSIEEWRLVFKDLPISARAYVPGLPRAVTGQWPGPLQFVPSPIWRTSESGLKALHARDFGEWLSDYHEGNAPAVCAATGESIALGPLEREVLPADLTMRYKGMKVGFRMCYVAQSDA